MKRPTVSQKHPRGAATPLDSRPCRGLDWIRAAVECGTIDRNLGMKPNRTPMDRERPGRDEHTLVGCPAGGIRGGGLIKHGLSKGEGVRTT
jgi:hypothetical protein